MLAFSPPTVLRAALERMIQEQAGENQAEADAAPSGDGRAVRGGKHKMSRDAAARLYVPESLMAEYPRRNFAVLLLISRDTPSYARCTAVLAWWCWCAKRALRSAGWRRAVWCRRS